MLSEIEKRPALPSLPRHSSCLCFSSLSSLSSRSLSLSLSLVSHSLMSLPFSLLSLCSLCCYPLSLLFSSRLSSPFLLSSFFPRPSLIHSLKETSCSVVRGPASLDLEEENASRTHAHTHTPGQRKDAQPQGRRHTPGQRKDTQPGSRQHTPGQRKDLGPGDASLKGRGEGDEEGEEEARRILTSTRMVASAWVEYGFEFFFFKLKSQTFDFVCALTFDF
jgi:hypothetical protein